MAIQIKKEMLHEKASQVKPLNILLVEDEPIAMAVNRRLLETMGYVPDVAVNGEEALAMCSNHYDLIFMDIGLPDINGIDVTAEIRRRENLSQACIIALTGYSLDEVQERCLQAGMNDVAQKPISLVALRNYIERFFG